ncbi:predicted protein [Chaetoceros tenuissimus]|uniref:Uncharacterized protein n=1 Tax=Chaetoceros tenuissimus TaxID=426638 RepID=A0AAD3HFP0_9STRA|nr:predicted protein [Chaetoceros tenuissimus]
MSDLLLREKDFANSNSIKRTSTSNSHTAPSFLQETNKKRKKKGEMRFHLASTLNFPYKEGLSSPSSVKEGIWKGQGEQADMLEKHFNSAWQCKFMMDFYGIGGSCHPHDEVAAGEQWNLREGEEKTSKKESTAILFNRDLSKDTTLNSKMVFPSFEDKGILVHSCREKRSDDTSKEYIYTEEDLKSASVKLMDAMDLTDDSRTKVFRIEESMNINRTKYLHDICMMK